MKRVPKYDITIHGAGRVGGAFALALARAGWRVALVSRAPARRRALAVPGVTLVRVPAPAPVQLLALPDHALVDAARLLAFAPASPRAVYLHCSGSRPVADLDFLRPCGAIGALHPLLPVPDARTGAAGLPRAQLTVQGETGAIRAGRKIARALGAPLAVLPARTDRLRYHAAAVLASNLPFAPWLAAEELLAPLAGGRAAARRWLRPLVESAARNFLAHGVDGLTGPARRNDRTLIAAQTAALREPARAVYRLLTADLLRRARRAK